MKMKQTALYCILILFAGFSLGSCFPVDDESITNFSQLGSVIAAFAALLTAYIAMQALGSWKVQSNYKIKLELCMTAYELLSDIRINSIVYSKALITITKNDTNYDAFQDATKPYSKSMAAYSKIYGKVEFLELNDILLGLSSDTEINNEINKIITDQLKIKDETVATLDKNAKEALEKLFGAKLLQLKKAAKKARFMS